jgi:TetR/AcrR family transcriptional regulator of autoinduction and epiphytic fitness
MAKVSFREQMQRAREEAIMASVNRLLAEKGFEAMTVDEVAADVGIAKASLYRHFVSKEALAAAAMVRVLDKALGLLQELAGNATLSPLERLKAATAWCMNQQLAGEMPSLPSQNSSLRQALVGHAGYLERLNDVSDLLGGWIEAAQASGALSPRWPPELVLYTLFARACDPVLGVLKATGQYSDAEVTALVLATCFEGLASRS